MLILYCFWLWLYKPPHHSAKSRLIDDITLGPGGAIKNRFIFWGVDIQIFV